MDQKIDIHKSKVNYRKSIDLLKKRKDISNRNKNLIIKFLNDCEIGKTVLGRQKKKISLSTLRKYLFSLIVVARNIKVDLDSLPPDDRNNKVMEDFIRRLESNKIRRDDGKTYSEKTKREIKIALRKFYKWLYGENKELPKLVSWIDTHVEQSEIEALTREEIEYWVSKVENVRHKALIMTLFDSDARAEEFLNIRMKHVSYDEGEGAYKVRIQFSKTLPRTIYLPIATPYLREYLRVYEDADNPNAQLFPYSYNYLRRFLRESSQRHLKKRVHPHLLRHSSATFYCEKLNPYQLCYRFGWRMSSSMPQRYIDSKGLTDKQTAKVIRIERDEVLMRENQKLKEEIIIIREQMKDYERLKEQFIKFVERRKEADEIMKALLNDKKILNALIARLEETGLGKRLRSIYSGI